MVSLQCLSDVKYHVTPFWKRMSFLWITCLFRDGFSLQINKASWIFLLKPLEDDDERICQWNLSPMFSFRYLDGAESCFGSSCWSHRFSAICFVSPTYDSSGLLMLVPLYMTLALCFIGSFNLNSVLIFLVCQTMHILKFFPVKSFSFFKNVCETFSFFSQNGNLIGKKVFSFVSASSFLWVLICFSLKSSTIEKRKMQKIRCYQS